MTGVVVLAAGGSSRMGRAKQLLPFRGRSLLRHAAEAAVAAGCGPVVVVLGAGAWEMQHELVGLNVEIAVNTDWAAGPGSSVRVGLAALPEAVEAAVFLLCDQPFADADHVRALLVAQAEAGLPMAASGYAGAVGVPAVFARECFAELSNLPPDAGAKRVLARDPARVAVVPFPAGAIDFDTPADYARWATPLPTLE